MATLILIFEGSMKVKLTLLSGTRRGQFIELSERDNTVNIYPYILEDEAVSIEFETLNEYEKVSLCLHENEMQFNIVEFDDTSKKWIYKLLPKKMQNNIYESFFFNYFGIAELYIAVENENFSKNIPLQRLDILAKKINAERVDDMLSFLSKNDSDALCAFFRVTRRMAGFKEGDIPVDIYLEWIEKTTNFLTDSIDKIISKPITKLTSHYKFISPNDSTNIDDQTLSWLCENIEELYEVDDNYSAILSYQDKFYSSKKVRETALHNDSDVYENQIIHGFIVTLKLATSSLLAGFDAPKLITENSKPHDGYVSFYNQLKKFQRKINQNKIKKCKEVLIKLGAIKIKIDHKIPVKRKTSGIPSLTAKVKNNKDYLSIFQTIIKWHRFGQPDWSVQEELLSIKSIPKLFEYYVLFYIKGVIEKKCNIELILNHEEESFFFHGSLINADISIYYEPKYWMPLNKKADSLGLINSEAWTINNNIIKPRKHPFANSNRSPDYVINAKKNGVDYFYVLDAKYTTSNRAFTYYLPELTLKYLHGLHLANEPKNNIIGLTIINPANLPLTRHYHSENYNIFSNKPVEPVINVASIQPGQEYQGNYEFERIVATITELLAKKLSADDYLMTASKIA
ncbi:DUF2357 domain-containing protein [Pantoea sp. MBD-2R]|uniref:DUF2357 domain-containing protein n=1 Tax=Pantoea sp. MBD-2R TaxID=3141540 RepID=UPI003183916E